MTQATHPHVPAASDRLLTFEVVVDPLLVLLVLSTVAQAVRMTKPLRGSDAIRPAARPVLLPTQLSSPVPRLGVETLTATSAVLVASRESATCTSTVPTVEVPRGRMVCVGVGLEETGGFEVSPPYATRSSTSQEARGAI